MGAHKRILVVDDEDQVLFVLRNSLKKLGNGYDIITARNGQAALAELRRAPFDLIITDLKMPGVDGLALTEVAYALAPGAKVIWMTAYDHWEPDAQRLGVYRYLLKPVDVDEIRTVAGEALQVSAASPKTRSRQRILIVDDEPQEALALSNTLDSPDSKYYVKISLAPEEALSSLKTEHFDLVITGLRQPDHDNLDLVRQVRRISPQTRAMVIAPDHSPEIEERARQLAATCLAGPPDLVEFKASVQRILG